MKDRHRYIVSRNATVQLVSFAELLSQVNMFSKWRTRKDEREKGAPEELTGVPNPLSEVYSLAKDLNNWIRRPQAGGPDISDLDGVKKFKDKYENREILEDGKVRDSYDVIRHR